MIYSFAQHVTHNEKQNFFQMEIHEIKQQLTLAQVLHYYHLKPDKQLRLNCPFHNDRTPSMQVYYKTHTCYCFSSNCKTHGKSLDVIDFIMYKENLTKREAILKAVEMINGSSPGHKPAAELTRIAVLTKMFTYFKNAIHNSKPAQEYLQSRCLDNQKTEVGYNSGQFHHGTRKDEALINSCLRYDLLLDLGTKGRTGTPAYKPFGKWGLVFPLRNKQNQIVSLYFRSTLSDKKQRHFYLKDRQGLYPKYPSRETKRLILTESIIDAATLLEQDKIKDHYKILSLYGTNGLTEEHTQAIAELTALEEIIFFLNGDQAGIKAVEKYAPMLKADYSEVKITQVQVPENEDVNSLLQGHSPDILTHLVETRKEYDFLFSTETAPQGIASAITNTAENKHPRELNEKIELLQEVETAEPPKETVQTGLDTNNSYNLKYQGNEANYQIKGFNINQLDSLKITLQITAK
jgi:DNA primase